MYCGVSVKNHKAKSEVHSIGQALKNVKPENIMIPQKIEELKKHLDPDGLDILKELEGLVTPYEPVFHLERLTDALSDEIDPEYLHDLVDALHSSTARYTMPDPQRFHSYKKDLTLFFRNCHEFINRDMPHAVLEYALLYHRVFNEPKKICGLPRISCHTKDCEGRFSDQSEVVCPECGAYRALCKNSASSNGRCMRIGSHGGRAMTGPLSRRAGTVGRAMTYERNLNGELKRMFIEAMVDEEYLSVAPEISALAARSGQLLGEIGDVDYLAVNASVSQAIRKMTEAVAEQEYWEAESQAVEIERLLTGVVDDKRRWDEIAALSGRLGRLSETERKRLIEQQKMITIQEMYMLREETLTHIRDAAGVVAAKVVRLLSKGREVKQRDIRQMILSTLHSVMKGDINADYYLNSVPEDTAVTIIDAE